MATAIVPSKGMLRTSPTSMAPKPVSADPVLAVMVANDVNAADIPAAARLTPLTILPNKVNVNKIVPISMANRINSFKALPASNILAASLLIGCNAINNSLFNKLTALPKFSSALSAASVAAAARFCDSV